VTSQSINPRSGEPFGPVFEDTSPTELDETVSASRAAWLTWAASPAQERADALEAVAQALDADAESLARIADAETGLGIDRLTGEVARATFQVRMFAQAVRDGSHLGVVIDEPTAGDPPAAHPAIRRMLLPVGPVAVYGASNFPFAFSVFGGDTVSALAAGCSVVAKAHPSHPQTCEAVAEIARAALAHVGAPEGVFSMVRGFDAGVGLVQHPLITAGAFTGSTGGGRALFDLASGRPEPIPFYGELGSVNPVVVSPEAAKRPGLAEAYVASMCLGTGQFCTNPGLLFAPRSTGLAQSIASLIVDQPPGVLLNGTIAANIDRHVEELAGAAGVETVRGEPRQPATGFTAAPVVMITGVAGALSAPQLLTTEVFGPVAVVVEYDSPAEVLQLIDVLNGCLVSTIHAEDEEDLVPSLIVALSRISGRIVWNGWPTGVAVTGAQHHGGPYPASTNALHTSVGATAMRRFQRPIAYQSMPTELLPPALHDDALARP